MFILSCSVPRKNISCIPEPFLAISCRSVSKNRLHCMCVKPQALHKKTCSVLDKKWQFLRILPCQLSKMLWNGCYLFSVKIIKHYVKFSLHSQWCRCANCVQSLEEWTVFGLEKSWKHSQLILIYCKWVIAGKGMINKMKWKSFVSVSWILTEIKQNQIMIFGIFWL